MDIIKTFTSLNTIKSVELYDNGVEINFNCLIYDKEENKWFVTIETDYNNYQQFEVLFDEEDCVELVIVRKDDRI